MVNFAAAPTRVAFDANGGAYTDSATVKTYSHSEIADGALPEIPVRSGYAFAGWNTAKDGSGSDCDGVTGIGEPNYYAVWIPVVQGSITVETLPLYSGESSLARSVAVYAGNADRVVFAVARYAGQKMLSFRIFGSETDENGYASAVIDVASDAVFDAEKILALDAGTFGPLSEAFSSQ
jgi:uncharacterized repeat protein (TIGR02543 family)